MTATVSTLVARLARYRSFIKRARAESLRGHNRAQVIKTLTEALNCNRPRAKKPRKHIPRNP
jgi:hypothetical protein